jgi:YhcH/YjgK/YiaL family protein
MIVDSLENARRYFAVHPGFEPAFKFLQDLGQSAIKEGRSEVEGSRLYALVVKGKGKGKASTRLETHNRYIDIQFTVSGVDLVGWEQRAVCRPHSEGYDPSKDVEFYRNNSASWVAVPANCFAIVFPEDAHAPMGTEGPVDKVVMKVAVEWTK